jgi:uncharacterized membrane protein YphA (DoxX/SURF4 family)
MAEGKGKTIVLWVVSGLLAALFLFAGFGKVSGDPQVAEGFGRYGYSLGFAKFIGVCELAGGVGLLIPRLATLAAGGLAIIIAGAIFTHLSHREMGPGVFTLVLLGVLLLVAWVRLPQLRPQG